MAERRNGCLIGCAVAGVIGLGLLAALGFGLFKLVGAAEQTLLDQKVYEAVSVGESERAVRDRLPEGGTFIEGALKDGGPAQPAGTTCAWYIADGTDGGDEVFRFCFRDGKLAEKVRYAMK
ncbi:hypothetical protein [Streptomyces sp. NPDC097619]|uniref:hypothetical protein n=1 Tax=Streptomyces sp. NPDC097619 TaxID=3157228 RepID=UPI00331B2737